MSDIVSAISYSTEQKNLIKEKLDDPNFTHKNWLDDDLVDVRKAIRDYYRNVQTGICSYCRNDVSLRAVGNARIEHIVPKAKRRDFIFEPKNLCVICEDCNTIKRDQETRGEDVDTLSSSRAKKYPRSSGAFLIVHPHFDDWNEHIVRFRSVYAGKTDKGDFTVGVCILNRKLREFGWEDEFLDEAALRQVMQAYLNETNPLKAEKLRRIVSEHLFVI